MEQRYTEKVFWRKICTPTHLKWPHSLSERENWPEELIRQKPHFVINLLHAHSKLDNFGKMTTVWLVWASLFFLLLPSESSSWRRFSDRSQMNAESNKKLNLNWQKSVSYIWNKCQVIKKPFGTIFNYLLCGRRSFAMESIVYCRIFGLTAYYLIVFDFHLHHVSIRSLLFTA